MGQNGGRRRRPMQRKPRSFSSTRVDRRYFAVFQASTLTPPAMCSPHPSPLPPPCVSLLCRQQHSQQPGQRKGIMRGRRSRSQSRARDVSSAAPSEADDDEDVSSPAMRGAGGASGGKRRRPRGGVLGSKLLRRSQTTGDMDAPQPKARASVRQDSSARYRSSL